jgi:hypothetical protein
MNIISNTINTPKANKVIRFQMNAHVDARMVVVRNTKNATIYHYKYMFSF